jgi:hypothetical protein
MRTVRSRGRFEERIGEEDSWLERIIITQEAAGSSPIAPANLSEQPPDPPHPPHPRSFGAGTQSGPLEVGG